MEFNQMRYFRAIVKHGSFTEAAEQMHITQPALSKSIAKMETELGAPLFERKGGRLTLTAAGKTLFPYCGTVLDTIESGRTAVQERIGLKKGHLSIAVSTEVFIKHLIRQFLRQYPEASLTCHLMTPEEMARALEEGMVDFVLSDQPVYGDNIDWQVIYRGNLTAVLRGDDPLLRKKSISMEELKDHWFCIGHVRSNLHSAIYQLCHEAGFEPKIRYLGYDPDLAGMLLEIPGSVIVSSDAINRSLAQANIGNDAFPAIPIRGTEGTSVVGMAARVGHYQSEAALTFYDMVAEFYQSIGTGK